MKPDDHKKKKSAQYQKKHQKSQGKSSDGGKKDKPGKPYEQRLNRREDGKQQKVDTQRTPAAIDPESSDLSSSESENEQPVRRTFQRRKIESNWNKYEETAVDHAKETQRKEDEFQRLLTAKVTADAQFRLQDEQEWDEELSTDEVPDVLSIDCKELAKSVLTIPIHTRLGIEDLAQQAGLSSSKEKSMHSKPTKTNLSSAFNKNIKSDTARKALSSNGSLTSALSDLLKRQTLDEEPSETAIISEADSTPAFDFSVPKAVPVFEKPKTEKEISEEFWNDTPQAGVKDVNSVPSVQEEKKVAVSCDDDDLDFLLSLDGPSTVPGSSKEAEASISGATVEDEETSRAKAAVVEITTTEEKKSEKKVETRQDLEDWLDSII